MRVVGFIKTRDGDYNFAKPFKEFIKKSPVNHDEVIAYLERGLLCVPITGIAQDKDGEFMGLESVYTDGTWFWPQYLISYLKKYPKIQLDDDFVDYCSNHINSKVELLENELTRLQKEFFQMANFHY